MQSKWTAGEIIRRLEEPTENKLPLMSQLRREARIVELVMALSLADDETTRCNLCDILAWRKAKTAVAVILACLDDPTSDDLKDTAAEALGKIESPKAGEELLRHFLK